jgi:branched-chain amino acid transport system substrate-binding protein
LANGYYGVFPYAWWTDDNPEIADIDAAFTAGGYPESDRAVGYMLSYGGLDAAVQLIEHSVDLYGYENLSGENVMNAFKDLGTVTGSGVITLTVEDGLRAPREAQIRQWQFGEDGSVEWAVVQDYFELPDTRPAG